MFDHLPEFYRPAAILWDSLCREAQEALVLWAVNEEYQRTDIAPEEVLAKWAVEAQQWYDRLEEADDED